MDAVEKLEFIGRLLAVELLVTDLIKDRYLSAPDPVSAAALHRASARRAIEDMAPLLDNREIDQAIRAYFAEAVDKLLVPAGELADAVAAEQGR